jgi:hypothetical protein
MRTGFCILVVSLLLFSMVSTGCTSPASPAVTPVAPRPTTRMGTETPALPAALPAAPPAPAAAAATTIAPAPPSPAATRGTEYFSEADVPDNPWTENLEFTRSYYPFTIPDCAMRTVFPEVAQDPGYGIRQPVPELTALSPERMDAFLQTYPDGYNSLAGCAAAPIGPGWNFVKIEGTIMPRNARPAEYDIGINVRSRGRVIAQFRMNETLTLEQPFSFERYVPLRSDEMELFDSIELVFSRKT